VTHPNYNRMAAAVGGSANQILIEGMTDHMRDQVWQALRPGLGGNTGLRQRVEGAHFQAPPDSRRVRAALFLRPERRCRHDRRDGYRG